jgi:hypothetical protein
MSPRGIPDAIERRAVTVRLRVELLDLLEERRLQFEEMFGLRPGLQDLIESLLMTGLKTNLERGARRKSKAVRKVRRA